MATFEAPLALPIERDFRSSHKDTKRHKDANVKWSRGVRTLPGRKWFDPDEDEQVAQATRVRARPVPKFSDMFSFTVKDHSNIVKASRNGYEHPASRHRSFTSTWEELNDGASRSIADLADSPSRRRASKSADAGNFLYSFDNTDSPPRGLALDVFVKPNVRATEKLVEKEYEVLDDNGDAVKGRKARKVLRKAAGTSPKTAAAAAGGASGSTALGAEVFLDEEEFELI